MSFQLGASNCSLVSREKKEDHKSVQCLSNIKEKKTPSVGGQGEGGWAPGPGPRTPRRARSWTGVPTAGQGRD